MKSRKRAEFTIFGKKVKKRLIDLNMTQVDLAAKIGISKQYLYKILCGERSGSKYLEEIRNILKMNEAVQVKNYEHK